MLGSIGTTLCFIAFAGSLFGYSPQVADTPQLQVTTSGNQTTFRMGERIPLQLAFTGPENKRFEITNAFYNRSGRMSWEHFAVSPDRGWVDPLKAYFSRGDGEGGLSSSSSLSTNPILVSIDLNEWVRFDQPGVYRVTVTSHRVSDLNLRGSGPFGSGGIELRSHPIELRIVAAKKVWQDAQLAGILDELKNVPKSSGEQTPARQAAIASLRYLGTSDAARVMAEHLREDEPDMEFQCVFGLMGLPPAVQPVAVAAMTKMIADPDFPLTAWFLNTYTSVQLGETNSDAQALKEQQQIETENLRLVVSGLPSKRGSAQTATAQTIWSMPKTEFTPQMEAALHAVLSSGFAELPIDKQTAELNYQWERIRSQELLPVLKQDALMADDDPRAKGYPDQARFLKEAAFRRWYELDPEEAHRALLSQIGSANPAVGPESLAFLPPEKLTQYEHTWASAFISASDFNKEARLASLMTRFGSGSEAPLVSEKANRLVGTWACAAQGAALAYLVKFDLASARPLIDRAIAERGRGKTACNRSLFQDIARWATDPILTEAAISTLKDPDPQVINDALIYLMSYGDKSAEKPILDRYILWSEHWKGREDVLEKREAGSSGNWAEIGLGQNLGRALIANQGWLADDALISRVLQLCVGKEGCDQLKQMADGTRAGPFGVTVFQSGALQNFQIAQYTCKSLDLLEAKIAQFPRGSKFMLPGPSDTEDQQRLELQVKALFEKHGMIVE